MTEDKSYRYIADHEIDNKAVVKPELLRTLDRFISCIGRVFNINCMTSGIHAKDSDHYKGFSADGSSGERKPDRIPSDADMDELVNNFRMLIKKPDKNLFEQMVIAKLAGFERIGIYPHWNNAGFHLSIAKNTDRYQSPCYWVGLSVSKLKDIIAKAEKEGNSQVYVYLNDK